MDFANECSCSRLIIAHNHPFGSFLASANDVKTTQKLVKMFRDFGIEIVDHIIVNPAGSTSMRSCLCGGSIWDDDSFITETMYI